jgi:hypothetical protein
MGVGQGVLGTQQMGALANAMPNSQTSPYAGLKPGVTSTPPVDSSNMFNANVGMANPTYQQVVNPISATNFVSNPNTATLGTGQTTNPFNASTSPYIQAAQATAMGNLYGAQTATQANRVNQNTLYGGLNYQQGVDAQGNPTWTANQTGTDQTQGLVNSSLAGLQQSINNPMYGINPGETYSSAIMRRLQPQMAQSAESNTAALANQGIVPGTQAYDNAMRTFQQGQNDLLTSAQIQGINTGLQAQQLQGTQAGQIKSLTTPNLINAPTQAAVAGPDYMGAVGSQTAAEIAANNARLGQQTANTQGLYGLGSAGILGLAANPGALTSAYNGLTGLLGIGASPGLGQTTNWLGQVVTDPTYGQGGSALNYASQAADPGNWLGI